MNPAYWLVGSGLFIGAVAAFSYARSRYIAFYIRATTDYIADLGKARAESRAEREAARLELEAIRAALDAAKAAHAEADSDAKRARDRLDHERELFGHREVALAERERAIAGREGLLSGIEAAHRQKLEEIAGLSAREAQDAVEAQIREDARRHAAKDARAIEQAIKSDADEKARRLLGIATQRLASRFAHDATTITVALPSEDWKGRIIGRDGRNIRALQESIGVDFVIDDTPGVLQVSSFDPVRREVARLAIEDLVADGRIHPTRIEEAARRAESRIDEGTKKAGEEALADLDLGAMDAALVFQVGQLRFRTSHSQNVLRHAVECGHLAGLLAAELGLDVRLARRAGLLHDIGKSLSDVEVGGHAMTGARFAKKHGEGDVVVNAIASHHDDEPQATVYASLVGAADALSSARPGARKETMEAHVKRLHDLESIAMRFAGVERSYAIQAGREVRVVVEPSEVTDAEAALLAREIAKAVESEMTYPGQIRVTVIREVRAVDYAR